jgi:hypothetical protein
MPKFCSFCISATTLSLPLFRLTPGVHRCSAIALRLGGAFVFFGLPPLSFVANNETLQQAPIHSCSSGWGCADSLHPPKFYCFCINSVGASFECTTDGTNARSRAHKRPMECLPIQLELELELIQTQMAHKPVLRVTANRQPQGSQDTLLRRQLISNLRSIGFE